MQDLDEGLIKVIVSDNVCDAALLTEDCASSKSTFRVYFHTSVQSDFFDSQSNYWQRLLMEPWILDGKVTRGKTSKHRRIIPAPLRRRRKNRRYPQLSVRMSSYSLRKRGVMMSQEAVPKRGVSVMMVLVTIMAKMGRCPSQIVNPYKPMKKRLPTKALQEVPTSQGA